MSVFIIYCLIAALLPYFAKVPVAYAMHQLQGYDNHLPRVQQEKLQGFGARALAAHQNSFESLIVFALAVAVVLGTQSHGPVMNTLALSYLIARVMYCIFYWIDLDKLRSLVWAVGLGCCIAMIALCI